MQKTFIAIFVGCVKFLKKVCGVFDIRWRCKNEEVELIINKF